MGEQRGFAPLLTVDLASVTVELNLRESGARFPCKWSSVLEIYTISTEDSLERFIQLSEDLKALSLIWTKLSREDQSLLEGKYILGYNNKELAEMFHCQHSSIRMKLTRARRNAFALLIEQEGKK